MILINAVYFYGEWKSQFDPSLTRKLPFFNLGNEKINVDTMTQITEFKYYEDKKCQAIQLDFLSDYMSAIIILPSEGTDINKFINSLAISSEEYNKIIDGFNYAKVHLQLPIFELEFKENLNEVLKDLGMYNAFKLEDADFTGLKEGGEIFINSVNHKIYLKVFEEGCEAVGITDLENEGASEIPDEEKIYDMKVNRPFLFLLKNSQLPKAHNLIFMSKIEKL